MFNLLKYLFLPFLFLTSLNTATAQESAFNEQFKKLLEAYNSPLGFNYAEVDINSLESIEARLKAVQDIMAMSIPSQINVYNYLVIREVLNVYPIQSVAAINNFFKTEINAGDQVLRLDNFEREVITKSNNPYIHFLFNCGARSCPELQYISDEQKLDSYISHALNNENILSVTDGKLGLSQIFFWYQEDFGSNKTILKELSRLTGNKALDSRSIEYLEYDWLLNDIDDRNGEGFYPTKLYAKGGYELKIFNNYYSQKDNGFTSNFFSSFFQLLLGSNKNFNYGLDVKLRSVNQGQVGTFSALGFRNRTFQENTNGEVFSRAGISGIGPRIKYQPFKSKNNINFLHTIYFVPMGSAEGNEDYGYSDYNNLQFFNQVFFEKELSVKRRLFVDAGLHIENIKLGVHRNEEHFMPIQLPVTAIYSYFPNSKTTLYGLGSFGQRVDVKFNRDTDTFGTYSVYGQIGAGAKYFVTDFLEAELLYTNFIDTTPGRTAHTFNLGLRFYRF